MYSVWVDKMRMSGRGKRKRRGYGSLATMHTLSPVVTRGPPKVDILFYYRFIYATMNTIIVAYMNL